MEVCSFDSRGPEETLELGLELARSLGAEGLAIALVGPLGAGKTVFVKGIAQGLGVDPRAVSSPTFVIAQQYGLPEGPEILHHLDLYRLESEDELEAIGFYDMLAPGSVLAVEWADRFPDVLGHELLQIEFDGPGLASDGEADSGEAISEATGPARRLVATAKGDRAERILEDWAGRMKRLASRSEQERAGIGSFIEMRLLVTLVIAFALLLAGRIGTEPEALDRCDAMAPEQTDVLGTLRARCVSIDEASRVAPGLEGIGRILAGGRIDLNRASPELLQTLPGIGPVRAEAIMRSRAERPFGSLRELERVPGIGPQTRARLAHWVGVAENGEGVAGDG